MPQTAPPLLEIRSLNVSLPGRERFFYAVRDLNLTVPPGSVTCVVGESGCGKSMACKAVLRLTPENAKLSGEIFFEGRNLLALPEKRLREIRGSRAAMIFQEPMTSLNPVLRVGEQTAEPLRLHLKMSRKEAREKVVELFGRVGIPAPENRYDDYPHRLSGGMRQRVMIAMALSCKPLLLLADEPTTALDSTIQGQILRLVLLENETRGMAVLLITHDLGVVADVADRVGVMYAGSLVEYAATRELFENPLHPYAHGLIQSAPSRDSIGKSRLPSIPGVVPNLENLPAGCAFQPRCPRALPVCSREAPPTLEFADRRVSCWLYAKK